MRILVLVAILIIAGIMSSVSFACATQSVESLQDLNKNNNKIYVVCSIPDLVPIVKEVGGSAVEVRAIMPPGSDPHAFTVSAKTVSEFENAKLIVLADSSLISFEGRIKKAYPDKCLDLSDYEKFGLKLDSFPGYKNCPHGYWLKLENGIAIAKAVEERLSKIDPSKSWYFKSNLQLFESQVREAEKVIAKQSRVKGLYCVAAVPGVCYVAENSGMKVGAVLMEESAGFASGAEMMQLEKELSSSKYACVIVPEFAKDTKVGQLASQLARDCGKPVVYVKFVMSTPNDTYVGIAYYNAMSLNSAGHIEKAGNTTPGFSALSSIVAIAGVLALALVRGGVGGR